MFYYRSRLFSITLVLKKNDLCSMYLITKDAGAHSISKDWLMLREENYLRMNLDATQTSTVGLLP